MSPEPTLDFNPCGINSAVYDGYYILCLQQLFRTTAYSVIGCKEPGAKYSNFKRSITIYTVLPCGIDDMYYGCASLGSRFQHKWDVSFHLPHFELSD